LPNQMPVITAPTHPGGPCLASRQLSDVEGECKTSSQFQHQCLNLPASTVNIHILSRIMILLVSLFLTMARATPQCPDCDAVSSLLSSCSLQPLTVNWTEIENAEKGPVYRNLSGVPYAPEPEAGPATVQIANYSQAECFCTEAIKSLNSCTGCILYGDDESADAKNRWKGSDAYFYDCTEFGYFANDTLAYPSTTRTSTPLQTGSPTTDCNVCGIIEGQISECGLIPLDGEKPEPKTIHSSADNSDYYAHILYNRTAGECFCTLPVLRTLSSCRYCIQSTDMMDVLDAYIFDCGALGYWTDSHVVDVEERPGSPSSASASQSSSATSTVRGGGFTSVPNLLNGSNRLHQGRGVLVGFVVLFAAFAII
jgi:hypothetical protein